MKVFWLVLASSDGDFLKNSTLFNKLKENHPEIELIMILGDSFKKRVQNLKIIPKFKLIFLKEPSFLIKLLLIPYKFLRFQNKNQRNAEFFFIYLMGYKKLLKNENPDCVVSNLIYQPYSWQTSRYCKSLGIPFIIQLEKKLFSPNLMTNYFEKIIQKLLNKLIKGFTHILSWTKAGVEFGKKNINVDKSHIKFLPAGINTKKFYNIPLKRSKDSNELLLLIVARLVPFKRHIDLLKALKYLNEKNTIDLSLTIIGEGYLKRDLLRTIKKYKISHLIKFIDKVPYESMKEIYSSYDVLILPSYNEALGMVVPEAMSCGLPVIVSDTVGAASYVKDGYNGYIFKTFDFIDLANKIIKLSNIHKRIEFGKNAMMHIRENFDTSIISNKFYEYVIDSIESKKRTF
ncbi:MAG: glycosyltransferase family 4 protein [Promethearchaeota archaeon]